MFILNSDKQVKQYCAHFETTMLRHFLLTGLDEKRVAKVKEPKLNLTTHALINHLTIPD